MIFGYTLDEVLSGNKWQTRRLSKPCEKLHEGQMALYIQEPGKRKVYETGKTYAVQPNRGKKAVARILLTSIRQERVIDISEEDARAEGFASRAAFLDKWHEIHGHSANLNQLVWVLDFVIHLPYFSIQELENARQRRLSADQSIDHGDDLSLAFAWVSRVDMHSGNN